MLEESIGEERRGERQRVRAIWCARSVGGAHRTLSTAKVASEDAGGSRGAAMGLKQGDIAGGGGSVRLAPETKQPRPHQLSKIW